jgi:hypothetical protein
MFRSCKSNVADANKKSFRRKPSRSLAICFFFVAAVSLKKDFPMLAF